MTANFIRILQSVLEVTENYELIIVQIIYSSLRVIIVIPVLN
jgi:hypothetical protein